MSVTCEVWWSMGRLTSGGSCEGMGWEGLREGVRWRSSVGSNRSTSASITDRRAAVYSSQSVDYLHKRLRLSQTLTRVRVWLRETTYS